MDRQVKSTRRAEQKARLRAEAMQRRNRFNRSATWPPKRATTRNGSASDSPINPRANGSPVRA